MSCSSTLFQSRSKQFYHGKKTQRRRSSATTGTVLVIALFIAGLVAAIFPTIVFLQSLMSPSPDEDILVESMHGFSSSSLIENRFVEDVPMQNISSVDYMACCGAGHRISKTADANYLARVLNFTLRSFWGFCDTSVTDPSGSETEVFFHLFGTQSIPNWIKSPASANMGQYARINNDVPGFKKLIRDGSCVSCNVEKARTDVAFYLDLRDRFRLKPAVEKFRTRHFTGKAVIGMHIRAGNGESGDFVQRGRAIYNLTMWMDSLTDQLVAIVKSQKWDNNAVIFIATDTPSLVDRIRMLLVEKKTPNSRTAVPVVHFDQVRPSEGSGVYFGVQGKVHSEGVECLHGWENTLTDMMLLSYADMVVAARPSSFTQSLPMSIVLARNTSARLAQNPYCEISPNATEMQCFRDFYDWCCRGRTEFSLKGIQRYDYLRMPQSDIGDDVDVENAITRKRFKISQRPESGCVPTPTNTKQICLPFNWSEFVLKRQGPRPNGDR